MAGRCDFPTPSLLQGLSVFPPGFPLPFWGQDLGGNSLGVRHTQSGNSTDTHTLDIPVEARDRQGLRAEVLGEPG